MGRIGFGQSARRRCAVASFQVVSENVWDDDTVGCMDPSDARVRGGQLIVSPGAIGGDSD